MASESPRDDWSTLASALTSDRRVMFVDDGHRTSHELVEGPGSSTIQRQVRDGRRFRAVKEIVCDGVGDSAKRT